MKDSHKTCLPFSARLACEKHRTFQRSAAVYWFLFERGIGLRF